MSRVPQAIEEHVIYRWGRDNGRRQGFLIGAIFSIVIALIASTAL